MDSPGVPQSSGWRRLPPVFLSGLVILVPGIVGYLWSYASHTATGRSLAVLCAVLAPLPPVAVALCLFRPQRPAIRLAAAAGGILAYGLLWVLLFVPSPALFVGPCGAGGIIAYVLFERICAWSTRAQHARAGAPSGRGPFLSAARYVVIALGAAAGLGALLLPYSLGMLTDAIYLLPPALALTSLLASSIFLVVYLGRQRHPTSAGVRALQEEL
jgi:hypothetical protein